MSARILVIEDNPANLELMTYLLKAFGYTTLTARDGEEGLEVASNESPDLIVCDVQLPKVNGYEVARQLKANPSLKLIPLIAVTAFAMVGDRDKVLAAGFDGYLAKPINPETFVGEVVAFLSLDQIVTATPPVTVSREAIPSADKCRTILVVDNVPTNLELARSLLEPFGYKVITANGIQEALERAKEFPPDLILSDVCMSEESGFDFIRIVKDDSKLRAIPFVFITSSKLEEKDRVKGLSLGANKYIFRPIEPQMLLAELESCLREKKE